jgi:hypothetical protein
VYPPSITTEAPVMYADASDARKTRERAERLGTGDLVDKHP